MANRIGPYRLDEELGRGSNLLSERFRLKLRRETKQLPVYNLVVARAAPN